MMPTAAKNYQHHTGHRWVIVCTMVATGREWVIDGAPDRSGAEERLERWAGRGAGEWGGEYTFRLEEAKP
jgi:hypothetical protein